MYIVQCKAEGRGGVWRDYSRPLTTRAEAQTVKEAAEGLYMLTVKGAQIVYRITREEAAQ